MNNYSMFGTMCTVCPAPNVVNAERTACTACAPGFGMRYDSDRSYCVECRTQSAEVEGIGMVNTTFSP
eukprot:SAG11_NODE_7861_length_1087_cov_0.808704_2_plen_67_part_01